MLGKMVIHGLVAAALVAGAAGVYAAAAGEDPLRTIASDRHDGHDHELDRHGEDD